MISDPYWVDNPFRLTGQASSLDYRSLRRHASRVAQSAKVNIVPHIPLGDKIDTGDLVDLPSKVRALATDNVARTEFRIMWPLAPVAVQLLCGEPVHTQDLPEYALRQADFLSAWLEFLEERIGEHAATALKLWHELASDAEMDEHLTRLLTEEEDVQDEAAFDQVCAAQDALEGHLLETTVRVAIQSWQEGDRQEAVAIVGAVLSSPLPKSAQEAALPPLVTIGDSLREEVRSLADVATIPEKRATVEVPSVVVQLEGLAEALRGRNPASRRWKAAADDWYDGVARSLWDFAFGLHEKGDNRGALELTKLALTFARSSKAKSHLTEQRNTLQENIDYGDIRPIKTTPSMGTLNGVGTMLYSTGNRFRPDPTREFAILFFTVVFIPVLPLSRYLVQSSGGNSWRFFGQTRWTLGMKLHLGIVVCAAFACFYGAAASGLTTGSYGTTDSSQPSYAPSSSSGTAPSPNLPSASDSQDTSTPSTAISPQDSRGSDAPAMPSPSNPGTDALTKEHDSLASEVNAQRPQIEKEQDGLVGAKKALDDDKAALDQRISTLDSIKSGLDLQTPDQSDPDQLARYNQQVDDYNAELRAYRLDEAAFNKRVDAYNVKLAAAKEHLREFNAKVDRVNELAQKLDSGGG